MKMKRSKTKLLVSIILAAIILSNLLLVIAYTSLYDDFEGSTHLGSGCHDGTNPESSSGEVSLISSSGTTVQPNEVFIITAQVNSFIEAGSETVSVGFPSGIPGRGDNKQFSINQTEYSAVSLDGSGDSGVLYFEVTAPSSIGNYTLVADALEGNNGVAKLDWATGSIVIEVIFGAVAEAPKFENLTNTADLLELGETQAIQVDVYDDETSVSITLINFDGINHTMIKNGINSYKYNSWTPITIGVKNYMIYASDTDGNWNVRAGSFTVHDNVAPKFENLTKTANSLELGDNLTITITALDIAGIRQVLIEFEGNNHSMTFIGANTWSYDSLTTESIGILQFTIYIQDYSNLWSLTTDSIQVVGNYTGDVISFEYLIIIGVIVALEVLVIVFIIRKSKKVEQTLGKPIAKGIVKDQIKKKLD